MTAAVEALSHVTHLILGNARSLIAHVEPSTAGAYAPFDEARLHMLDGVLVQVPDRQSQAVQVALHGEALEPRVNESPNAGRLAHTVNGLGYQCTDIGLDGRVIGSLRIELGGIEELPDQPRRSVDAGNDLPQRTPDNVRIRRDQGNLSLRLQSGQWRSQLVRREGCHFSLVAASCLDLREQTVQRVSDGTDLCVRAPGIDGAHVVGASGREIAGHPPQRPQAPPEARPDQ